MIAARDHKLLSRLSLDHSANSRTSLSTRASGMSREESAMAMENRSLLMVLCFRATGGTIRSTEKAGESSPTGMFTKVSGATTNSMAPASTNTLTVPLTLASGKRTNSTATELKLGPTVQDLRANMSPGRKMELENLIGLTPVSIKVPFKATSFMAKGGIDGQTDEFITETG